MKVVALIKERGGPASRLVHPCMHNLEVMGTCHLFMCSQASPVYCQGYCEAQGARAGLVLQGAGARYA